MTPPDQTNLLLAMIVGCGLMLVAHYAMRRWDPPMLIRIGLGAMLVSIGVAAFTLWPGLSTLVREPVQFGLAVFLVGFGINQLGAPLRRAMGKQV